MKLRILVVVTAILSCVCALNAATFNVINGDVAGLITAITMANTNGRMT